jgi:hypothetical protein
VWADGAVPTDKAHEGLLDIPRWLIESAISREAAKARKGGDRVRQLPKTFCWNEGVLECSGLTELWMGIERADGKSKAVSSHRSPRNKDTESHAKARRREEKEERGFP